MLIRAVIFLAELWKHSMAGRFLENTKCLSTTRLWNHC